MNLIKMMSAIEILQRQAIKTFMPSNSKLFEENFKKLGEYVNRITSEDVNLEESLNSNNEFERSKTDVGYIEIYDDNLISMGIFVLRPGAMLPLHDHPHMHGILKVLSGGLKINSYTRIDTSCLLYTDSVKKYILRNPRNDNVFLTIQSVEANKEKSDDACVLTNVDANFHEITHTKGEYSAFLDILAPPYEEYEGRGCHYYKNVENIIENNVTYSILKEISPPLSYRSCNLPYCGPRL